MGAYADGTFITNFAKIAECQSDNDCSGYDPDTHTKMVCRCPNTLDCSLLGDTYKCEKSLIVQIT
ncbi:MAG: hypothetical protein NWE95_01915, partial [Candidatus Bathyarchaeota archaeon]|nr:hypothetical protein [Candidatus Bathyarchaeota archaeon]